MVQQQLESKFIGNIQQVPSDLSDIIITGDVSEGYRWNYITISELAGLTASDLTTDQVAEGSNNLYFTDQRAKDALKTLFLDPKDSSYTVLINDHNKFIPADTNLGNVTITLPDVGDAKQGFKVLIGNRGTGTTIVDGNGSDTINGSATFNIVENYGVAVIECDGSAWYVTTEANGVPDVPAATETDKGTVELGTLQDNINKTAVGESGAGIAMQPKNTATFSSEAEEGKVPLLKSNKKIDRFLSEIDYNMSDYIAGEDLTTNLIGSDEREGTVFVADKDGYVAHKDQNLDFGGAEIPFGQLGGNIKAGFSFTTPGTSELADSIKEMDLYLTITTNLSNGAGLLVDDIKCNLYESDKTTPVAGFIEVILDPGQVMRWGERGSNDNVTEQQYPIYPITIDMQSIDLLPNTEYFLELDRTGALSSTTYYNVKLSTDPNQAGFGYSTFNGATWSDSTSNPYFDIRYQKDTVPGKVYYSDGRYKELRIFDGLIISGADVDETVRIATLGRINNTSIPSSEGKYYLVGEKGLTSVNPISPEEDRIHVWNVTAGEIDLLSDKKRKEVSNSLIVAGEDYIIENITDFGPNLNPHFLETTFEDFGRVYIEKGGTYSVRFAMDSDNNTGDGTFRAVADGVTVGQSNYSNAGSGGTPDFRTFTFTIEDDSLVVLQFRRTASSRTEIEQYRLSYSTEFKDQEKPSNSLSGV